MPNKTTAAEGSSAAIPYNAAFAFVGTCNYSTKRQPIMLCELFSRGCLC